MFLWNNLLLRRFGASASYFGVSSFWFDVFAHLHFGASAFRRFGILLLSCNSFSFATVQRWIECNGALGVPDQFRRPRSLQFTRINLINQVSSAGAVTESGQGAICHWHGTALCPIRYFKCTVFLYRPNFTDDYHKLVCGGSEWVAASTPSAYMTKPPLRGRTDPLCTSARGSFFIFGAFSALLVVKINHLNNK